MSKRTQEIVGEPGYPHVPLCQKIIGRTLTILLVDIFTYFLVHKTEMPLTLLGFGKIFLRSFQHVVGIFRTVIATFCRAYDILCF